MPHQGVGKNVHHLVKISRVNKIGRTPTARARLVALTLVILAYSLEVSWLTLAILAYSSEASTSSDRCFRTARTATNATPIQTPARARSESRRRMATWVELRVRRASHAVLPPGEANGCRRCFVLIKLDKLLLQKKM